MLDDRFILITGASGGIGEAAARLAVANGANVFLGGRDEEKLNALAEELGEAATPFCYDVTDAEQTKSAFSHISQHVGQLDGLVNCAGIMHDAAVAMTRLDDLHAMLNVNTVAAYQHAQLASRIMSRQKAGSIVNLCSVVGEQGSAGQSAYAASKAAVSGMTKSLAKELGPLNIRVNGVAPGFIDTAMTEGYTDEQRMRVLASIPLGRFGRPNDVAGMIVLLLSDNLSYITGQVIGIDGGMRV